jgi:hypothetical protein
MHGPLNIRPRRNVKNYRSLATREAQLKIWHFGFIGTEIKVCRCTFNRYNGLKIHKFWVASLLSQISDMHLILLRWSLYIPGVVAQRVGRGITLLFHDRNTRRWVSGQQHAPGHTLPPGNFRCPHFTGGWVGHRAGLDGAKNLVPTGIRSRTVQPLVSSYTDWATGPAPNIVGNSKCLPVN